MHEASQLPTGDLFRVAFELAPSGMLAVGANGSILMANREAERMFRCESGRMVGVPVDRFVPSKVRGGHDALREGFMREPRARTMGAGRDLYALRCDGTEFPVEIGLAPVHMPSGTVVIAMVVDITARREAERTAAERDARAREAQKLEALGTLAGGIAHDFNNVLLGIAGYTELAQRSLGNVPAVNDDLEQVLKAAERGRQLVRRILMFARHREGPRESVELARVVREAAALLRASLPSTIEIKLALASDLPPVLADETMIHQVVLNLGTNASHAMPDGGVLELALDAVAADAEFAARHSGIMPGPGVRLRVSDNGSGMPAEVRERMFEPFYTTKAAGKGSGLGLSVTLGIVQMHQGAIDVDSAPGQGTRIEIWLPAQSRSVGAAAGLGKGEWTATRKHHVLFVEDEPALAAMERRQLESLGLRVTVHTSSLEALEDFRSRPLEFDVMVTDNTMPHMTGLVLSREVTMLRPGLPVLMVSGYADHAEPDVLRLHGVSAVLGKPHGVRELGEALEKLLEPR